MKITRATVYSLKCDDFDFAYADASAWKSGRILHLLEIELDNGLSGWGEWGWYIGLGEVPPVPDFTPAFACLTDKDPLAQADRFREFAVQPGTTNFMLAAVDMALWDLRGKIAGLSLSQLLGGALRPDIPVYASLQNYRDIDDPQAWVVELVEQHYDAGFRAFKMKIGGAAIADDCAYIQAVRDCLGARDGGSRIPLAVDANQTYTRSEARQMGRFLEQANNIAWFEEPLIRADISGYRSLRQTLDVPIAGAEGCGTAGDVDGYLRAEALDVIQPDLLAVGGITPMLDICALGRLYHVPVYVHCFFGCIERIAALHLMALQPTWGSPLRGLHEALLEWETSCFPARDALLTETFHPNDQGRIAVPTGPGLGVAICRECIEAYLWRS